MQPVTDTSKSRVRLVECDGTSEHQLWEYDNDNRLFRHLKSGLVLEVEWCHDKLCPDEHAQLYKHERESKHRNQNFLLDEDDRIVFERNGHCLGVCESSSVG